MRAFASAVCFLLAVVVLIGCDKGPVSTNKSFEDTTKEKGKNMSADIKIPKQ